MNTNTKHKRFLAPILTLAIVSIISIVTIITYLNITIFEKHMQNSIEKYQKEYLQKNKDIIYKKVHLVNDSITFQIAQVENKLKQELQQRIKISSKIIESIYNQYKKQLTKKQIIQKFPFILKLLSIIMVEVIII